MTLSFRISPLTFLRVLLGTTAVLIAMHLVLLFFRDLGGMQLRALSLLFDVRQEANIPTLYSVLLFVVSGTALLTIHVVAILSERRRWQWLFLAAVFFFLALDEGSQIHEKWIEATRRIMGGVPHSSLNYTWVVPYSVATLLLAIVMGPFLLSLPKRTLRLFLWSGFMFLSGAVAMEMIEGMVAFEMGEEGLVYKLLNTMEELLEMCGLSLFVFALFDHLATYDAEFRLTVRKV